MPNAVFSEPYNALLRRLVATRKAAGLRQAELAQRLNKPQSFVSKIERGERRLDVIEFLIVMRAMGEDGAAMIAHVAADLPSEATL